MDWDRYAHAYRASRAIVAAVAMTVVALWLWLRPVHEVVDIREVTAEVVEVNSGPPPRHTRARQMSTVRVRLPGGDETRVMAHEPLPRVGDTVTLVQERYADGDVRYRHPVDRP